VSRLEEAVGVIKAFFAGGSSTTPATTTRSPPRDVSGNGAEARPADPARRRRPAHDPLRGRGSHIVAINPATKSNEAWAEQNIADASAEAVDRKIKTIRDAAGTRFDDIELQIVVPFVVPTDDRDGTAQAIAAGLPADPAVDLSAQTVLASPYC